MTPFEVAITQYGIKEIPGEKDNPEIMKYFHECGWTEDNWKDETAWCSAAMNWCCMVAGYQRTAQLNARSWLHAGFKVESPQVGDAIVFWRESPESWKGHVGIFIAQRNGLIYCLGGNQGNEFNIRPYPENRLLEYRRLIRV